MLDGGKLAESASLIPEFYYDLIARIPAGTVLTLGLIWVGWFLPPPGPLGFSAIKDMNVGPATVILFLLLAAAYALGMLLTAPGHLVRKLYQYKLADPFLKDKQLLAECYKLGLSPPVGSNRAFFEWFDQDLHDYLKTNNDQARVVLAKMMAEAEMFNNLVSALFLLALLAGYVAIRRNVFEQERAVLASILTAALVSFWVAYDRTWRYMRRQVSFLHVVMVSKLAAVACSHAKAAVNPSN